VNSKCAPAAGLQHRQCGRDDRIGVLEAVRFGQFARQIQQRLTRVVERALPVAGRSLAQAQLALIERKVAADRQGRRREDPGSGMVGDLLGEYFGHR
jgi:hypothetical protein